MHELKSIILTNWICYLITRINVILSDIYLESCFFLVRGQGAENIEEKIKTDRRKTLINETKEKRIIQGKSNNNNEQHWIYLFHKKLNFAQNYSSNR